MTNKTKAVIWLACGVAVALLGVLILLTKEFAFSAMLHIFTRALAVVVVLWLLHRAFKAENPGSIKKLTAICGVMLTVDMVIVDGVRFILSRGVSTVLFLPACVPLMLIVVLHYSFENSGYKKEGRRLGWLIGIPLFLLSLYFEALSFTDVL